MILQINKVRKAAKGDIVKETTDYIDGVSRTFTSLNEVTAVMKDGSQLIIRMEYDDDDIITDNPLDLGKNLDLVIKITPLEPFYISYYITKVYLLNDEGKTLQKLM